MMLGRGLFLAALGFLVGSATPVLAHVHLKNSQPLANSTEETAPAAITLWFTEGLETALCTVTVVDDAGDRVESGQATHDSAESNVLHVALGKLPAGLYKTVWRVVAADGHAMTGTFRFSIAP
jgi:methionine-rich copper-binding protein CopC